MEPLLLSYVAFCGKAAVHSTGDMEELMEKDKCHMNKLKFLLLLSWVLRPAISVHH